VNEKTKAIIQELKNKNTTHVVLDADAITVCAKENLFPLPPTWIVTPHEGELARCLNVSSEWIHENRIEAITRAHEKIGCVILLKGHHTLVKGARDTIYRIRSGNAALAKAGTGDVLAGILTAFRAQGLSATRAAVLAAYVHGATANVWVAQKNDMLSMCASDVIDLLPHVLRRLRSANVSLP
jgi:NAD(P)H-hydrate epimerase